MDTELMLQNRRGSSLRRKFFMLGGLLTLVMGAQLVGCAAAAVGTGVAVGAMIMTDRRTSSAQLDDEAIELRSASRLTDALSGRGHINVTSYNRRVLLTGEVGSDQERQIAGRTVSGVSNVRAIVNELAVMPDSTISERTNDTVITGRVKASLLDASLSVNAFKVVTERGIVYLMGRVSNTESEIAANAARKVPGVVKVIRSVEILSLEEQRQLQ
jgi:osmotically-inducible protein OsmY